MALAVVLFVLLVPILASQAYPNPFNMVDCCFLPFYGFLHPAALVMLVPAMLGPFSFLG